MSNHVTSSVSSAFPRAYSPQYQHGNYSRDQKRFYAKVGPKFVILPVEYDFTGLNNIIDFYHEQRRQRYYSITEVFKE
ncbi:hypothetical protein BLOT_007785 [Blomia tropicalis]|nr:hypothetical protein BLOT_007785 [Blomia tropicalis]